jgi:hypothetical protein
MPPLPFVTSEVQERLTTGSAARASVRVKHQERIALNPAVYKRVEYPSTDYYWSSAVSTWGRIICHFVLNGSQFYLTDPASND